MIYYMSVTRSLIGSIFKASIWRRGADRGWSQRFPCPPVLRLLPRLFRGMASGNTQRLVRPMSLTNEYCVRLCLVLAVLGTSVLILGCNGDSGLPVSEQGQQSGVQPTLLALGDSYTVGQSLPWQWCWPAQLADSLAARGDTLAALDVIAQTGWTTRDLLDAVRDSFASGNHPRDTYGMVTLMIGVNNQFQGVDQGIFAAELDTLLDLATALAGDDPARVLGFSIPDYGVTPVGQMFGAERIAAEIEAHNEILSAIEKHLDLYGYKVFFFGSRVIEKGDERSDIDVGIEGAKAIPLKTIGAIQESLDSIPMLYKIEIVDFKQVTHEFYDVAKKTVEAIN